MRTFRAVVADSIHYKENEKEEEVEEGQNTEKKDTVWKQRRNTGPKNESCLQEEGPAAQEKEKRLLHTCEAKPVGWSSRTVSHRKQTDTYIYVHKGVTLSQFSWSMDPPLFFARATLTAVVTSLSKTGVGVCFPHQNERKEAKKRCLSKSVASAQTSRSTCSVPFNYPAVKKKKKEENTEEVHRQS